MGIEEITKRSYDFKGFPDERMWKVCDPDSGREIIVFADEDPQTMEAIDWILRKADSLGYFDYKAAAEQHKGRQTDWLGLFNGDCLSDKGQKAKWPLFLSIATGYETEVDKIKDLLGEFNPKLRLEFETWLRSRG